MSVTRSSLVRFILLGLLVLALLLTVFFSQESQQTQQHAATSSISNHGAAGISPGFGFEEPFGKMNSSQQQTVINNMKSDGVRWLRLDYYPNVSFDYEFIKDAESAGINVDVVLEDFTGTPTDFANFGRQAVNTFKPLGVNTYEILNEVNTYTPLITASDYVLILKAVYPAIKAADSSATVLMSGLDFSGKPDAYLQAMYDAGAKGYFDAVNAHPYSYPDMAAPTHCPSSNAFCHGLPSLYTTMQQNGDSNKKIWITEFGCPTGTDAGRPAACTDMTLAQQITQAFNQANAWGWTGPLFIFSWQDDTKAGDFGLYDLNGSPKTAALAAFRRAAFYYN
jgi:polysaccharide biosynthesis protein PslG